VEDFRAARMPSPEGRGIAKSRLAQAWDAYAATVGKAARPVLGPVVMPLAKALAARWVEDLLGFWLIWHLEGGFDGLQRVGMSRSAIYRRIASFRKQYGVHPDEFVMPGVTIDLDAYLAATGRGPLPVKAVTHSEQ
jgi:hypothetical protein